MPRFMMFVQIELTGDGQEWNPTPEAVAAMTRYNEELTKAGALLALDGLHPPEKGARVTFPGGKPTVLDGPYAEAKEVVGGYWVIQAKSLEEAVEWAKRVPMGDGADIEVRQIFEMSDFPSDVQEAAGELSQTPRDQTSAA
jgi:hypothetical protein